MRVICAILAALVLGACAVEPPAATDMSKRLYHEAHYRAVASLR